MTPYYYEPAIIHETSEGMTRYSIQDALFQYREIHCVGPVDTDMVNSLIAQIRYLSMEAPEKEITMYINSPGGSVTEGMALYDVMQAVSCPIRTVCTGMAASMASLLFVAGDQRDMLEHAHLMIHDPLMQNVSGSALKIDTVSRNLMETRALMASIYSKVSEKSMEEIYALTRQDTLLDAPTALQMCFADRIIEKL